MTNAINRDYSLKTIRNGLFGLLALCAAMKATGGAGFVLIFIPVLLAFAKNRTALLAFVLLTTAFLTMTNDFFAPKDMIYSIAARLVYVLIAGVMILQNTGRKTAPILIPILSLLFYIAYQAITSSVGWSPIISYLKMLLFLIVFLAFFGMANATSNRNEVRYDALRNMVLIFAVFIIGGSFALIPFPGIGKMGAAKALEMGLSVKSVGLFMGVANQPQALGPLVSGLAIFLLSDMLFSLKRWDKLYISLLFCAPILIFYTSSRTAMGTYLAGSFFATFLFMNARGVGSRWKARALNTLILIGIVCGVTLFATPQMREAVAQFTLKWTGGEQDTEMTYDNITASRQGLIDSAMENFSESPMIGNGFQVSKAYQDLDVQSWKQLLSAPIEKGVWITAVLEEGGVFGMGLFILFILIALSGLLKHKAYIGASLLFTFIICNLGEFTLFSMSGIGGTMWAMVFSGIAIDAQRIHQQRMALNSLNVWQGSTLQGYPPYPQMTY